MVRRVPLYQIDAFTGTAFTGNPAAVCLLDSPLNATWMQAIASEMAMSETAFLLRAGTRWWQSADTFRLRWFTPTTEVPLCGHATLATAAVLFDVIGVEADAVTFQTLSGDLVARRGTQGIALDFPLDAPRPCAPPADVLEALGLSPTAVVDTAFGVATRKLLIHLGDEAFVRALRPAFPALQDAESMREYRGLIVTAAGHPPYDFVSRFFAPWIGIDEDPVTGSAHTLLTPYWAGRLGKTALRAFQASARGGELRVRLLGEDRVELVGQATLVLEGHLTLPEEACTNLVDAGA